MKEKPKEDTSSSSKKERYDRLFGKDNFVDSKTRDKREC